MSSSIMSLLKLPRTILILTLVTGIVHAMEIGKPNTFWSKRTGQQELSDKMQKDGSQFKAKIICFSNQKEEKGLAILLQRLQIHPLSTIQLKI